MIDEFKEMQKIGKVRCKICSKRGEPPPKAIKRINRKRARRRMGSAKFLEVDNA